MKICILLICALGRLQAGDLYAIVLCDVYAHNIEESVMVDRGLVKEAIDRIASNTALRLIDIDFSGSGLIPMEIYDYISRLEFYPEDVIFFYFSGHGYRSPSKKGNPWPNLYCSVTGQGIDFLSITSKLKEKNPGFLLAICDCCNNSLKESGAPQVYGKALGVSVRYKKLFLETKGSILVRSSDVGEYSWCNDQGSLYTVAFLEALQREDDWDSLLKVASDKVKKHQTACYEIAVE